ncbi:MAG: hypothetical protein RIR62_663 [Pseudomonadota bacterium]
MRALLKARIAAFARDTRGAALVEMLFALILLNFVLIAFYIWWDAYRQQARVERTTYTISDLVSRERGSTLQRPFLDGLERVAEYLLREEQNAAIRFTQVTRTSGTPANGTTGLTVNWSYSPCNRYPPSRTDPSFDLNEFPIMALGSTMIMVEMRVPYDPESLLETFVGLNPQTFRRAVIAMPRFENQPFTLQGTGTSTCID